MERNERRKAPRKGDHRAEKKKGRQTGRSASPGSCKKRTVATRSYGQKELEDVTFTSSSLLIIWGVELRGVGREVISLFVYNLCTVTRKKAHFLLIKKKGRSWGWGILHFCKKYQNLLLSLILGKSEQRPPRSWGSFPLPPPSPRLPQQGHPSPWGEWGVRQHSPGGGDKGRLGWTAGCWPR